MSTIGGKDFTSFKNLRVKGKPGTSPGAVRIVATSAFESTLSVNTSYQDANYQWTLPAHSGGIGITGTFTVQTEAISAGSFYETNVVVTGIRAEDALVCTVQDTFNTVTTNRPQAFLAGAAPGNGAIAMTFYNPTGTATIYNALICAYTAYR